MSPDKNQKDNPIQNEYDKKLNPIRSIEKEGTLNRHEGDSISDAEGNPNSNWKNNVTGGDKSYHTNSKSSTLGDKVGRGVVSDRINPQNLKMSYSGLKKRGPLIAIIITLFGGGIGITALLSPSILLVQFKEIMVNKFNTQLSSMDVRTNKLLSKKTLSGGCGSGLTIACKYSTMSKKQIQKFEDAGIKVHYEEKNLFGRAKPTDFEFGEEKIAAKDFNKALANNPEFRIAVTKAYNPKFAGFADSIWKKATAKLGITKAKANIDGSTDEERLKSIQEDTKNPNMTDQATAEHVTTKNTNPETNRKYTQAEADAFNKSAEKAAAATNELEESAAKAASKGTKVAPEILAGATTVVNTLKITGLLDNACTVYNTVRAIGFAAKTVRALQLAKYAMVFLNVADQIKAGTAKSEDVAYLSKILTTEVAATATSAGFGTATNSFGYKFAAYGERGAMPTLASQFLAGGGLTGELIDVTSLIDNTIRKSTGLSPKKACRIMNNPFVSGGSLIAGIGLMLIPGVNVAIGLKDVIQGFTGAALQTATIFLPGLLQDIIAGVLVDKTTVGEAAGEAITSGSSGIMSTTANTGGNAPLTPAQAVAYNNLSNQIAAQYSADSRLASSPLDASNPDTFLGTIVTRLLPYATSTSSFSSIISSVASIATGSFNLLAPKLAYAASTDDYTMCQDYDYRNMGLATDPYCNVTYGIPPEYLDADPVKIADTLVRAGQIDSVSGDPIPNSQYESFVNNCIDRKTPLGDNSNGSDGSECLFGKKYKGVVNNDYYIHYIDQRVQAGMDDTNITTTTPTSTPTSDAQQLAKEILANDKIDLSYVGLAGVSVRTDVQDAADGKVGSAGAMTSAAILQLIAAVGRDHTVSISAIQSGGQGHSSGSAHYSGDAVDFSILDGSKIKGRNAPALTIMKIAEGILPTGSAFGQKECGITPTLPSGWTTFNDTCDHLHVQVPAGTP